MLGYLAHVCRLLCSAGAVCKDVLQFALLLIAYHKKKRCLEAKVPHTHKNTLPVQPILRLLEPAQWGNNLVTIRSLQSGDY
jgi:hypothetical protein